MRSAARVLLGSRESIREPLLLKHLVCSRIEREVLHSQSHCTLSRSSRRAAKDEWRTSGRHGARCHAKGSTLVLKLLAAPGLPQKAHAFLHELTPLAAVDPEHLELCRVVARSNNDVEPTAAEDVEDGQVLSDHDRIMERKENGRQVNRDARRDRCNRRAQNHDRWAPIVLGAMVLPDADRIQPLVIGPASHLQTRRVHL